MPPADASGDRAQGYVLAFDFGLRHIGVASGQTVTGSAGPLTTVAARDGVPRWNELLALVATWQPIRLLVGLPLNMDGSESDMSARARSFAEALSRRSGVPSEMVDERLTSRAALARGGSHDLAAALIAETWLGEQR